MLRRTSAPNSRAGHRVTGMSSTQSFHGCWTDTSIKCAGLLASLKPYQRRALAWMVAREESGEPARQSRSIILVPTFRVLSWGHPWVQSAGLQGWSPHEHASREDPARVPKTTRSCDPLPSMSQGSSKLQLPWCTAPTTRASYCSIGTPETGRCSDRGRLCALVVLELSIELGRAGEDSAMGLVALGT